VRLIEPPSYCHNIIIGVLDRGAGRAVAPLGFGKVVKFGHSGD